MKRLAVLALALLSCGDDATGIRVEPEWTQTLAPVGPRVVGHNAVWSRGGLGLWDDMAAAPNATVMPLVTDLKPGVLRFPGGTRAMRYHFAQAIGANRMPQCDAFTGMTDATSYGPDEFLRLAEMLHAEVTLVAPWVDGTPEEAAALVAYVNADTSSTVMIGVDANGFDWGTAGQWAARRVQNGHPAPYGVKFLEIGNEQYHDIPVGPPVSCGRASVFRQDERWVNGAPIPTTAADHATQVARYAQRIHQVDPTIQVGASAYSLYDNSDAADAIADLDQRMGTGDAWNRKLVTAGGFDYFILHPYDFSTGDTRITLPERVRTTIHDLRAIAPDQGVAITEFGFLLDGNTLLNALVSADMVRVAVEEHVLMLLRHVLIEDNDTEPFSDSAAILGADHQLTPGYKMMQLLARDLQPTAVPVTSSDPDVVALATRDDAAHTLGIVVIDRRTRGSARSIDLTLPSGHWSGTTTMVSATSLTATDPSFAQSPVTANGSLHLQLPAHAALEAQLELH